MGGGGNHESREAGRKVTWVRHQLLNLVLEFAFIIKSVVFSFRVGLFLTATHLPQKMFLFVRCSAADVQLAVRCSDTLDSISGPQLCTYAKFPSSMSEHLPQSGALLIRHHQ